MSERDEHWQKYIEGRVYQLREMMCWWPETSGITEAVAQYLMRTLPAELDAYAAEVRAAALREAATQLEILNETETGVYAMGWAAAVDQLRRMTEGGGA